MSREGNIFGTAMEGGSKSRLGRALINELWASKRQETELRGLPRLVLDCSIILLTKRDD